MYTSRRVLLKRVHFFVHLNLALVLLMGYILFVAGLETATLNEVSLKFIVYVVKTRFVLVFFSGCMYNCCSVFALLVCECFYVDVV